MGLLYDISKDYLYQKASPKAQRKRKENLLPDCLPSRS
jgi:hypothetical protein